MLQCQITNATALSAWRNAWLDRCLIMQIGIAAKNGVLIIEFANHLRDGGNEFIAAIVKASVRCR